MKNYLPKYLKAQINRQIPGKSFSNEKTVQHSVENFQKEITYKEDKMGIKYLFPSLFLLSKCQCQAVEFYEVFKEYRKRSSTNCIYETITLTEHPNKDSTRKLQAIPLMKIHVKILNIG